MRGPYVNEEGDIWIERGSAPWPRIQREARSMATEVLDFYPNGILRYEGIETDVRVSDTREAPHMFDEDRCEEDGCCRTIVAHHFRAVEP